MAAEVDPGIAALFGGRTRAAILGVLANASRPVTAYRVARVTGTQVIKVSSELRRLERAGVAARTPRRGRAWAWTLVDPSLATFLRKRVRLFWWEDWNSQVGARITRAGRPRPKRLNLLRFRPNPGAVPRPKEFIRPASKDRVLEEVGLRPAGRRSRAR